MKQITFTSLIQIVFILLKLFNVINWSWILVLSPTWITIGIVLVLIISYCIFYLGQSQLDEKLKEHNKK